MLPQRRAQAREVALAQRHRPTARNTAGRVGETDEPLAAVGLEQLHDRREPPVARLLAHGQFLDQFRPSPWCLGFRRRH